VNLNDELKKMPRAQARAILEVGATKAMIIKLEAKQAERLKNLERTKKMLAKIS
jgi:hypothetical protein